MLNDRPRISLVVSPEVHLALKIEATKRRITVQDLVKAECRDLFARVLAAYPEVLK